ncbi:hypothetical protein BANRA_03501 [Escherichia coli]|uniref:Uncharacterized protein n=1 Tax=Escherichia coli TaxID=562 RepID=A0A3P5DUV1_ECOLX|nr:hypothetical protein BANRA_03501 [Escherichia coli]
MMTTNENAKLAFFRAAPPRGRPPHREDPPKKGDCHYCLCSMSDKTARRRFYIKRFVSATNHHNLAAIPFICRADLLRNHPRPDAHFTVQNRHNIAGQPCYPERRNRCSAYRYPWCWLLLCWLSVPASVQHHQVSSPPPLKRECH